FHAPLGIGRVDGLAPAVAQSLRRSRAGHFPPMIVRINAGALGAEPQNGHRDNLREGFEAPIALRALSLRFVTSGIVDEGYADTRQVSLRIFPHLAQQFHKSFVSLAC